MSKVTRKEYSSVCRFWNNSTKEDKIELILDYWQEGWYEGDQGDVIDELRGLHNRSEKPLNSWSDGEVDGEYEIALKYFEIWGQE